MRPDRRLNRNNKGTTARCKDVVRLFGSEADNTSPEYREDHSIGMTRTLAVTFTQPGGKLRGTGSFIEDGTSHQYSAPYKSPGPMSVSGRKKARVRIEFVVMHPPPFAG
jgi:hypothetical protein